MAGRAEEVVFRPEDNVTDARGRPRVSEGVFSIILPLSEGVDEQVVCAREAQNRRVDVRIQSNVGNRDRDTHVKAIGHAVVGKHTDGIDCRLQGERRLHQVALNPGV